MNKSLDLVVGSNFRTRSAFVSITETLGLRIYTVGAWVLPITLDLQVLSALVYRTARYASICMLVADDDMDRRFQITITTNSQRYFGILSHE